MYLNVVEQGGAHPGGQFEQLQTVSPHTTLTNTYIRDSRGLPDEKMGGECFGTKLCRLLPEQRHIIYPLFVHLSLL